MSDSTIEKVPRENSNDRNAMWVGDTIFFISDRGGAATLYSFDTKSKKVEQAVHNEGLDVKSASATSDAIVFEQFGVLNVYDIKSKKSQKVDVRLAGDIPTVRPRYEKVGTRIATARLSPNGARAVFEARGEIISVPAEKGDARNLTNTTGTMERDPAWSPDGKWITYFSDESGEYALHVREQTDQRNPKDQPRESSILLLFTHGRLTARKSPLRQAADPVVCRAGQGTPVKIDKNPFGLNDSVMEPSWSRTAGCYYINSFRTSSERCSSIRWSENKPDHRWMSDAGMPRSTRTGSISTSLRSTNIGSGNQLC